MSERNRRAVLAALASGSLTALAGCGGGDDTGTATGTATGTVPGTAPETTTRGTHTGSATGVETAEPSPAADTTSDVNTNDLAWPSYRGDPGNTARSAVAVGPAGPPSKAWQFSLDADGLPKLDYVPSVADGTVYAAGHRDGETLGVYALDAETGAAQWTHEDEIPDGNRERPGPVAGIAVDHAGVYVGDTAGAMAVDRASGEVRWTSEALLTRPAVVEGTLYSRGAAPDGALGIVGLDAASGEVTVEWTGSDFPLPPAFDDSRAYLLESPGDANRFDMVAVSLADGSEAWRAPVNDHGATPYPRFPVVHRNTVLTATAPLHGGESIPRRVRALDAETGRQRWQVTVGETNDSRVTSLVAADGVVYVVVNRRNEPDAVLAHDVATGQRAWRQTARGNVGEGAIATDDTLYVPGEAPLALSLTDGKKLWRGKQFAPWPLAVGAGGFYGGELEVRGYRS